MLERHDVALGPLTTLPLGGPARRVLEPADEIELIEAVHDADAAGEPVLLLGGGSNLVLADALRPVAERHGVSQAAVAVAWTLA